MDGVSDHSSDNNSDGGLDNNSDNNLNDVSDNISGDELGFLKNIESNIDASNILLNDSFILRNISKKTSTDKEDIEKRQRLCLELNMKLYLIYYIVKKVNSFSNLSEIQIKEKLFNEIKEDVINGLSNSFYIYLVMIILCDDRLKENEFLNFCDENRSFVDMFNSTNSKCYNKFLSYIFIDIELINDLSNQFINKIKEFPNVTMSDSIIYLKTCSGFLINKKIYSYEFEEIIKDYVEFKKKYIEESVSKSKRYMKENIFNFKVWKIAIGSLEEDTFKFKFVELFIENQKELKKKGEKLKQLDALAIEEIRQRNALEKEEKNQGNALRKEETNQLEALKQKEIHQKHVLIEEKIELEQEEFSKRYALEKEEINQRYALEKKLEKNFERNKSFSKNNLYNKGSKNKLISGVIIVGLVASIAVVAYYFFNNYLSEES